MVRARDLPVHLTCLSLLLLRNCSFLLEHTIPHDAEATPLVSLKPGERLNSLTSHRPSFLLFPILRKVYSFIYPSKLQDATR